MSFDRLPREGVAAAALLALDIVIRLVGGGPYPGATFLLLAACGISLLPLLPNQFGTPSLRLAVLPALAVGAFAILLTTVSIVGISLTELSIRLAVLGFVVVLAAVGVMWRPRSAAPISWRKEGTTLVVLVGVFAFSLGSSLDIAGTYPPRGMDWGHYLLYADEVEAQRRLLIDDPLAGAEGRVFADPAAIGAVYGSFRILDGVSSRPLAAGVVVVSALTPISVYAAVGALWGVGAGLLAAAAYAVSPIRLEPMYWHGLATTLALLFFPLIVLALGLMYRGRRDRSTIALLGFSLAGVAVSHSTSAVVAALLIGVVVFVELVRWLSGRRAAHDRQWSGALRPALAGVGVAVVLGGGVIAHLRLQSADLGSPVSYRLFEPDWLDLQTLVDYYSWPFLALAALSVLLLLASGRLRRDRALLALAALGLASILVGQLWRIHVPYEYRRAVYYLGIALAMAVGAASLRLPRTAAWIAGYVLVLAYIAHSSIGLRLPERLLAGEQEKSAAVEALIELRGELDAGRQPEARLVVADSCLHFVVPYLLRRPTIAAFEDWQVGFSNRVPLARQAVEVLRGGPKGRRLAESMGVDYVVLDPRCTEDPDLGGTVVAQNDVVTIIRLAAA
ncbi:MAG: hypothetical protein M3546_00220 [Actinomycetota bacterium]|nr:hypothetical protein [Actinomycetota bacterium]